MICLVNDWKIELILFDAPSSFPKFFQSIIPNTFFHFLHLFFSARGQQLLQFNPLLLPLKLKRYFQAYRTQVILLEVHRIDIEIIGIVAHCRILFNEVRSKATSGGIQIKNNMLSPTILLDYDGNSQFRHLLSELLLIE